MSRDHRKLRAFEHADALVLEVYKATKMFPREELYALTSQMRRAAVSVPANIVEGCARDGQKEYRQFLNQAFGSLRELGYFIDLSSRLEYIDKDYGLMLMQKYDETARTLAALIKSLKTF